MVYIFWRDKLLLLIFYWTALGYVMGSRITNKCGFFAFGYDMVAKYIKKFTENKKESKLTKEFLLENGF